MEHRTSTHRLLGVLFGVFLGLHVPAIYFFWRAVSVRREWWLNFLQQEFSGGGSTYVAMTILSVVAFAIVCGYIGWRYDEKEAHAADVHVSNVELSRQAATDGLTGLFNGATIREQLQVEIDNSLRSPFACLLIDVDYFKRINDKHGHAVGDSVLSRMAFVLRNSVRRLDAVGRLGGEEFLLLLPGTPLSKAIVKADQIRENVERETFPAGDSGLHVTVSIGVASTQMPGLDKNEILRAADAALYKAKREGRNRVIMWDSSLGFEVKGA